MSANTSSSDTELARCECCSMTEEYTEAYIQSVRNLYAGNFICGLCSEAVKCEIFRLGNKKQRRIGVEYALAIHMKICGGFVASPSPAIDFISAIGEMFRRRLILDVPKDVTPASPSSPLFPGSIAVVDGGAICAAAVIGGTERCLSAFSGGA